MSIDISNITNSNICVFPSSNRNTVDSRLLTEDRIARILASSPIKAWTISGNRASGSVEFVLAGRYFNVKGLSLSSAGTERIYAEIKITEVTDLTNDPTETGLYDYISASSYADSSSGTYDGLRIYSTSSAVAIDPETNMYVDGVKRTMLLFESDGSLCELRYSIDCGNI